MHQLSQNYFDLFDLIIPLSAHCRTVQATVRVSISYGPISAINVAIHVPHHIDE